MTSNKVLTPTGAKAKISVGMLRAPSTEALSGATIDDRYRLVDLPGAEQAYTQGVLVRRTQSLGLLGLERTRVQTPVADSYWRMVE